MLAIMITTAITATITRIIPIITFLFFHHILFFTFLEVLRISKDWSDKTSAFFTSTSIFSPLSITLFMLRNACSSSSLSSFRKLDSLSTSYLLENLAIHSCKVGLKSFSECPTALFLLTWSYLEKKASWMRFRKLTAILVSYFFMLKLRLSLPWP